MRFQTTFFGHLISIQEKDAHEREIPVVNHLRIKGQLVHVDDLNAAIAQAPTQVKVKIRTDA
jgi:hypothetical protein